MFHDTHPESLRYVGQGPARLESKQKLTGQATYVADMAMSGMLHARVKTSPHARARIIKIDTSKAEALPGVRAVVTGEELDYRLGLYVVDKYILAKGEVRHYGEAVAAVAADSVVIAEQAVQLIEVEYEVLTPVLQPLDAIKEDAPLVHADLGSYDYFKPAFTPQPGTNIVNHNKIRKGDVEKAFAEADYVIERFYTNPSVQHVPIETHVSIAKWGMDDQITIWSAAQSPHTVKNLFAVAFKIPHRNVRIQVPYIGGGFGGKAGIGLEPLVAVLSREAGGRPVRLQATREEEFSLLPCRSGLQQRIKTGVSADGRILAQQMTQYWDAGAYADYAVNVQRAASYSGSGPYEIPNCWVDSYALYTNKPYSTAYRGFGHVEFHWGIERHMELVASAIDMDPYEFRLKNLLRPGSRTITGEEITPHTGNVIKCVETVAESIGYGKLTDEEKEREQRTGRKIGKAVAALQKAPAMPPFTAASVVAKMNQDGTVTLNVSLTDMGQGTYTSLAQLAAERLKFPLEKIHVAFETDTDRDPYDWQTVASKGLMLSGNATILAAEDLLKNAYEVASQILRATAHDMDHDDEKIFIKHHPGRSISFKEIAVGYAYPDGNGIGGPLIGVGRYMAQGLGHIDKETGQGLPALDWTYGAHGMVVEADPETGEYTILKIASAFDVGKAINTGLVRGQAIGGMLQGLGTAFCEGYIFDEQGRLLNPSFTDNKIPTAMDLPLEVDAYVVETAQIDGPYGARGVGEHSMISVCSALGNALQQAVGVELTHMPMRFEDVWRALNNKTPIDNWITKSPVGSCRSAPELRRHE